MQIRERIENGSLIALNSYLTTYLPLVFRIAKEYDDRGVVITARIMAGNLGLLNTLTRVKDKPTAARFYTTLEHDIREAICTQIVEQYRVERIPNLYIGEHYHVDEANRCGGIPVLLSLVPKRGECILHAGDLLQTIDDNPITSRHELNLQLKPLRKGDIFKLGFWRKNSFFTGYMNCSE